MEDTELEIEDAELEGTGTLEEPEVMVKPVITKQQEIEMFKALAFKSYKAVAMEFGLHHFYKSDVAMKTVVLNIARKIRKAPEVYGMSNDVVEIVDEAIASRSTVNPTARAETEIAQESFRDKLDTMRDKVASMIMKKLEKYDKSGKTLDDINLKDLKDLLIATIDKSRLLRGESTENIARLSKIDTDNLSPEDAIKLVMKARDALIENKK